MEGEEHHPPTAAASIATPDTIVGGNGGGEEPNCEAAPGSATTTTTTISTTTTTTTTTTTRGDRVKGPWSPEEDAVLSRLVAKFGARNWSLIARGISGRSGKSCRLRWCNQLDPCVKRKPFSGGLVLVCVVCFSPIAETVACSLIVADL